MALASQQKALAGQRSGYYDAEITPVSIEQKKVDPIIVAKDEHPSDTSLEALGKLKGVVRPDGSVTAGNASGVTDGACALLLADEQVTGRYSLTPRARVVGMATAGVPPRITGIDPAPTHAAQPCLPSTCWRRPKTEPFLRVVPTENWARCSTYPAAFLCSRGRGVITMDMIGRIRRFHRRKKKSEREIARRARQLRVAVP